MTDKSSKQDSKRNSLDEREARLSAALRANLRRRKTMKRKQSTQAKDYDSSSS